MTIGRYKFGRTSEKNLIGVHPLLVDIVRTGLGMGIMDFGAAEGLRTFDQQKIYYQTGRSKTLNSYHLKQPDGYGHALDLYPYPINMRKVRANSPVEISRFGVLNGILQSVALAKKATLTWGADWDNDGQTLDHSFFDAMHWQIEV